MDFTISGNVSLAKFNMEQNGASVLSLDSIYTAIDSIQLQQGFVINEIYIKGLSTGYDVYNDRTSNLDYLFIAGNDSIVEANEPVEEPDSTTAAMPRIRIEKLRIADTRIRYTDATMYKPFDYTVSDIEVTADRFDSDSINSLQLKATLQEKGNARINWRGRIDSLSDLSLLLTLDNVQLTDFTPFCGQMFGYPIHSGILSFSSRNDIRNNQLTGTNKLDILRCELGSKESNVDAEMNLPLKMGLYLLKDKNDHADKGRYQFAAIFLQENHSEHSDEYSGEGNHGTDTDSRRCYGIERHGSAKHRIRSGNRKAEYGSSYVTHRCGRRLSDFLLGRECSDP